LGKFQCRNSRNIGKFQSLRFVRYRTIENKYSGLTAFRVAAGAIFLLFYLAQKLLNRSCINSELTIGKAGRMIKTGDEKKATPIFNGSAVAAQLRGGCISAEPFPKSIRFGFFIRRC
jgi:hypothetical protein